MVVIRANLSKIIRAPRSNMDLSDEDHENATPTNIIIRVPQRFTSSIPFSDDHDLVLTTLLPY